MNGYALFWNAFSYEQNAFHSLYFYFWILLREQVLKAFDSLSFKLVNKGIFRFSNRANRQLWPGVNWPGPVICKYRFLVCSASMCQVSICSLAGLCRNKLLNVEAGNSPGKPGAGFTLAANCPSDPSLVTLPLRISDSKLRCLGHLNDALSWKSLVWIPHSQCYKVLCVCVFLLFPYNTSHVLEVTTLVQTFIIQWIWVCPKADPDTRIWIQVTNFGSDLRKHWEWQWKWDS